MEIICEHLIDSDVCIIRTMTYNHSLDYLQNLFAEAKKAFPNLTSEDVRITHFAGQRYAKTFGIEFNADKKLIPKSYNEVTKLEITY